MKNSNNYEHYDENATRDETVVTRKSKAHLLSEDEEAHEVGSHE